MKQLQRCWMRFWAGVVGSLFLLFGTAGCKPEGNVAGDACILPEPPEPPIESVAGGLRAPDQTPSDVQLMGKAGPPVNEQLPPEGLPMGVQEVPQTPQPEQTPPEMLPGAMEPPAKEQCPTDAMLPGEAAPEQVPPEAMIIGDPAPEQIPPEQREGGDMMPPVTPAPEQQAPEQLIGGGLGVSPNRTPEQIATEGYGVGDVYTGGPVPD